MSARKAALTAGLIERSETEDMKKNSIWIIPAIIALLIGFLSGFYSGRNTGNKTDAPEPIPEAAQENNAEASAVPAELQLLNREALSHMSDDGNTIYVIGHKSPDSDTVCSAIAYARFLNMLGYKAEPRITMPVNNETAYILEQAGAEVPEILESAAGETIFLVDHSEYVQAADDMVDAHIVGIMDHHGVGTVNTGHQIVYEARPIGATATIVWMDYMNCGFEIDPQTAHILLGAVLSDTGNLSGSTVTEADKKAVPALAEIAGVSDVEGFYKELHEKAMSYEGFSDIEIMFSDYKEYEAGSVKYGIGLVNSTNEETSKELAGRMKNVAEEAMASRDVDYMFAGVGIREGDVKVDYIVPMSEESKQLMEDAFPHYDEYDGTSFIFRNGGLGRKSRFVPGLNDYFASHPHE